MVQNNNRLPQSEQLESIVENEEFQSMPISNNLSGFEKVFPNLELMGTENVISSHPQIQQWMLDQLEFVTSVSPDIKSD